MSAPAFDLALLDGLEGPGLDEGPLFFVEKPDGRRDWPEADRQHALFRFMYGRAPQVMGFAIPNAGKRHPYWATKSGIVAGVFDTAWLGPNGLTAYIELKGYSARGQPGRLSRAQIEWGNSAHRLGIPVACFFAPHAAAEWLRRLGFPMEEAP